MIDDILYKVMYKNNFEEIIILRDTIILEYLLQRRNSDYKISKYLSELIEQLKTYKLDISYGYGYTSILYMCNLVNIDGINDFYKNISLFIKKSLFEILSYPMPITINNKFNILFDYFKGLSGIFSYYIYISNDNNLKKKIFNYLLKCIQITNCFCKEVNISVAHGMSGILLILAEYMDQNGVKKEYVEIIEPLYKSIYYELKTKCYKKEMLSVAWGNGELGMFYALCRFYSVCNKNVQLPEYRQMLNNILNKTHLNSISKLNVCYGGIGTFLILEKINTIDSSYSYYIDKFVKKIKTKDLIKKRDETGIISVKEYSIINGILAEYLFEHKENIDAKYLKYFML